MWIATTKIWAVKDSLKRVVDYASYPEKTEYSGLANALHYAENDVKTELCETVHLVSGLHCRPEQAWDDMRSIQEHFGKTGGTVALHAYQSFKPGEVTPEQCHAIGVELARKMWGGRFQVLVATHLNTNCLHNHFVINSVSYIDGKKYEQKRSQYYDLRTASDDICRAHELSVIKQPLGKTPRQLYEAEQRGEPTRYNQMRAAIHEAKAKTSTERDFARALDGLGYVWSRAPNRKYATLCARDGGRAVRVYRLGAEYDWPAIEAALHENFARWGPRYYDWQCNPHHTAKEPQRTAVRHTGRYKCRGLSNARKPTGLWQMYMYYCYRLGIYPRQKPTVNWPEIRAQWRDTDRLCRELDFVTRHRFKSVDAISDYRAAIAGRAKAMRAERTECTRQLRRKSCHPSQADTLEMRRSELTAGLKEMRCEDALAASVIERIERTRKSRSLMHEQDTPVPQRGKSCVRSQMER